MDLIYASLVKGLRYRKTHLSDRLTLDLTHAIYSFPEQFLNDMSNLQDGTCSIILG